MIVNVDLKRTSAVRIKIFCESNHVNLEMMKGFEFVTDKFNLFVTEAAFQWQIN